MKLVFATNNKHKLEEVSAILGTGFELVTPARLGITEDIPETQETLEGNALQKARYLRERTGLDVFADDTGLEVTALGGAPGVYSARYAAVGDADFCVAKSAVGVISLDNPHADLRSTGGPRSMIAIPTFDDNNRLLLRNLEGAADRSARFRTVIALILDGREHLFEGTVEGRIIEEYRGTEGFGYDPVFIPEGCDRTFAEMPAAEKNAISHRARAVEKLREFLLDYEL
jgi:XTP/dITP diphosphohydrolase